MSPADDGTVPGARFLAEIREQPAALLRLLEHDDEIARIAALVRDRDLRLVRMVGHGSSDNAASYGIYAFGLLPRWTALGLDHPQRALRHPARHVRLDDHRPVAVRPYAGRPRVRRAGACRRRVHHRGHQRPVVGARRHGGGDDPADGGARARGRRDEDLREHPGRARVARGSSRRPGSGAIRRDPPDERADGRVDSGARAHDGQARASRSRTRAACSSSGAASSSRPRARSH